MKEHHISEIKGLLYGGYTLYLVDNSYTLLGSLFGLISTIYLALGVYEFYKGE